MQQVKARGRRYAPPVFEALAVQESKCVDNREITLNLLARNRGGYLIFDMLDHPQAPKLKLSKDELWDALIALKNEGLVAQMQERLDGPLFTLSKEGRALMSEIGYDFDEDKIEKSRTLFSSYFCKAEI